MKIDLGELMAGKAAESKAKTATIEAEVAAPVETAAPVAENSAGVTKEVLADLKAKTPRRDSVYNATLEKSGVDAVTLVEASQNPYKKDLPASLLTPEAIAYMDGRTSAAVASAVGEVMLKFGPMLEKLMAPSPKALAEQNAIDAALERNRRENKEAQSADGENRRRILLMRANCQHRDKNEKSSICLSHNYFDGRPRGVCVQCNDVLHPTELRSNPPAYRDSKAKAEWFIEELARQGTPGVKLGAPDASGRYMTLIWPAHRDYRRVIQQEQEQS
jgi:hypothetical protein